jgi:aspartyl-tRNA synthetase
MSEQNGAPAEQSQSIPERPKEAEEGEKGPSKNALKKAAKEKEKVFQWNNDSITHPLCVC